MDEGGRRAVGRSCEAARGGAKFRVSPIHNEGATFCVSVRKLGVIVHVI
jgi:hypothetical protein